MTSSHNSTYSYLLKLLSESLYGNAKSTFSLGATLSEKEWQQVFAEAEKQTVTGVLFSAVSRLPEMEMPPVSLLATWLAMAHRDNRANASMSNILSATVGNLESLGLHPVLQKGHAAARFYPEPQLRACGDIDLWFPGGERAVADNLVRKSGINVVSTPDNGSCYVSDSTEVEHHSRLIEIHNPFHAGLLKELNETHPPVKVNLSATLTVTVPAPIVELIMINAHILKHCLGVGIGLRQFCDYAMAWRALTLPDPSTGKASVDPGEYFEICRRLGIISWTRVLHQFINRYIPAPDGGTAVDIVEWLEETDTVDKIFMLVAEGGNFGRYSQRRPQRAKQTQWQRKLSTMTAFFNNRSFVFRLAPCEAFWTFTRLLVGQIH